MKWQLASSTDKDYIFKLAEIKGWFDNPPKVQVKQIKGMETWYIIEPYEENCNCPDLIKPEIDAQQEDE